MGGEGGVRTDAFTKFDVCTDKNNMPSDLRNLGRGGQGMHIKILSLIYLDWMKLEIHFFVKWPYSWGSYQYSSKNSKTCVKQPLSKRQILRPIIA